jgi:molybdate transport system substrate-binding protein
MRSRLGALFLSIAAAALFHLAAGAEETRELNVFAAASLTESFNELGKAFEAAHPGVTVNFSYAGSNQLRTQMEHGARADVFASANTKEMEAAVKAKLIGADTVKTFAHNRLVVIVPKENPGKVFALTELSKPGLKFIMADSAVPVGKYTLDMLDKMAGDDAYGPKFKEGVLKNVVSREDSVKAVVAKVRLGVADAGVAYVSDVTAAAAKEINAIEIPDAFNLRAAYPIAPLAKAPQPRLAQDFVAFVISDQGQKVLVKYGFLRGLSDKEK